MKPCRLRGTLLVNFIFYPIEGNFTRGILATAYTHYTGNLEEAQELYKAFYRNAVFTHISEAPIHLKQVVNTNNCHIHLHKHKDVLLITSAIDNLLKGSLWTSHSEHEPHFWYGGRFGITA